MANYKTVPIYLLSVNFIIVINLTKIISTLYYVIIITSYLLGNFYCGDCCYACIEQVNTVA